MIKTLAPIRARAEGFKNNPAGVMEWLRSGAEKARKLAHRTIGEVRDKMGFLHG